MFQTKLLKKKKTGDPGVILEASSEKIPEKNQKEIQGKSQQKFIQKMSEETQA